jgi:elongation factor Ts
MTNLLAPSRLCGDLLRRSLASASAAPRAVSLEAIKELRSRSGAPMAMVKDALVVENGDVDAAAERLRRDGSRLAALRTGRAAQEGLVGVLGDAASSTAALVELQCETDFVARTAVFHDVLSTFAQAALERPVGSGGLVEVDGRELAAVDGNDAVLAHAAAVLGEHICIGRVSIVRGDCVGLYVHGSVPRHEDAKASNLHVGRIGVAVALGGVAVSPALTLVADRLALHIAAEAPQYLRRDAIPEEVLQKEMDILMEAARSEEGKPGAKPKPDKILHNVVKGRLNKWLADVVLEQQIMLVGDDDAAGVKPDTVVKWLQRAQEGAEILSFARLSIS